MKEVLFKDIKQNPILKNKNKILMSANVIKYNNKFYLYVEERSNKYSKKYNTTPHSKIAVYESKDLVKWKRLKTLLKPKDFNRINLEAPCAINVKNKIYLYYNDYDGEITNILLTILKDPVTIEKHFGGVVCAKSKKLLDYPYAKEPDVIKFKNKYLMFYEGTHNCDIQTCPHGKEDPDHARVLLAESKDGIKWTKKGMIIDHMVNSWTNMHSSPGGTVVINNKIYMILNGANNDVSKHKFQWAPFNIGIAKSTSGKKWKISKSPIMKYGKKPWKKHLIFSSCFLKDNNKLYIFYQADDQVIALAESKVDKILKSKLFK